MKTPLAMIAALVLCTVAMAPRARAIEGPSNVKEQGNAGKDKPE